MNTSPVSECDALVEFTVQTSQMKWTVFAIVVESSINVTNCVVVSYENVPVERR